MVLGVIYGLVLQDKFARSPLMSGGWNQGQAVQQHPVAIILELIVIHHPRHYMKHQKASSPSHPETFCFCAVCLPDSLFVKGGHPSSVVAMSLAGVASPPFNTHTAPSVQWAHGVAGS